LGPPAQQDLLALGPAAQPNPTAFALIDQNLGILDVALLSNPMLLNLYL
jgi:hypothetical protein